MDNLYVICEECKYAECDFYEYYGGHRRYFIDGCKKDEEPYYDKEQEAVECENFVRKEARDEY